MAETLYRLRTPLSDKCARGSTGPAGQTQLNERGIVTKLCEGTPAGPFFPSVLFYFLPLRNTYEVPSIGASAFSTLCLCIGLTLPPVLLIQPTNALDSNIQAQTV